MSDLLAILSQGAASLAAMQAAAATASHNLQNANTPGYARQRANLQAVLPAERVSMAYIGRGVSLQTVSQARDRFLEAQIAAQLGLSARSGTAAGTLEAVDALDPTASGNLQGALSGFYGALRGAAQSPADPGLRQAVIANARTLALTFQRTRAALEGARSGVDAQIAGTVTEVNGLAARVADLNGQIREARAIGSAEPNDLLDARQKAVDRLAELTGVSPVPTSDGDVSLFLPGGSALVSGLEAGRLSTQADAANDGHLSLLLASSRGTAQPFSGMGGELGGALDARDGALRTAVAALDQLAWDVAGAVNAAHQAGYGLDGTTGDALFVQSASPAPPAGAAARIDVTAALLADPRRLAAATALATPTSAPSGDAGNLQAIIATERAALTGGLDAFARLAKITSDFGSASSSASALAEHDLGMKDNLVQMRESVSGVSVDEELIELQKAQKAYEAITRVIQTSSAMFDTLLQLK